MAGPDTWSTVLLNYNIDYTMLEACHSLKILELCFHERVWYATEVLLYFFIDGVSLFLASVRCFAMAIDVLRLLLCWNYIDDGVVVWWVSSYMSLDSCFHMVLTPCRKCCGEVAANGYALKVHSFVLDKSATLFYGGLLWWFG